MKTIDIIQLFLIIYLVIVYLYPAIVLLVNHLTDSKYETCPDKWETMAFTAWISIAIFLYMTVNIDSAVSNAIGNAIIIPAMEFVSKIFIFAGVFILALCSAPWPYILLFLLLFLIAYYVIVFLIAIFTGENFKEINKGFQKVIAWIIFIAIIAAITIKVSTP